VSDHYCAVARAIVCALTLTLAANSGVAADETRITNASNVRLRAAPATDAAIVRELPLGAELTVVGNSGGAEPWYHVRTADRRDGWVAGALTTALDPTHRDQIVESIVEARLHSSGDFAAVVQLAAFIERNAVRLKDRDARGRFALYRLRALSAVFSSVPFRVRDRGVELQLPEAEPYGTWIRGHLDAARYNEVAGAWMVDPEYVRAVHDSHSNAAAADEIAWFYVANGLFGECEGDVPCYVSWKNQLDGWYLRSHPGGRHTDESTLDIARSLNAAMDNLQQFPKVLAEFDPAARCGELHESPDPLTAAVKASTSTRKSDALAALNRYAQLCK